MKKYIFVRLSILTLLIAALNACGMFGANYSKPEVAQPKYWLNEKLFTKQSGFSVANLRWWQNFHDDQLNNLINEVLANNNDINKALVNMQTAKISLEAVEDNWVPNIGLSAGNIVGSLPPILNNQNIVFGGVMVDYNLNVLKMLRENRLSKLNIKLQNAILDSVRLSIISQTATAYYDLIAAREQLKINQEDISDLELLQKYLQIQLQQGIISRLELTHNKEQELLLESKLPVIKTNITNLENVIQVLLNHNPDKYPTSMTLANVNTDDVLPHKISANVLEQRPDIKIATYNLKIAASKIGVEYANLFPEFDLMAPIGMETMGNIGVGGYTSSSYWLAFIQGSLPILSPTTYDNIDKAKSIYNAQRYTYIQTVHAAFGDVDNGLAQQRNSSTSLNYLVRQRAEFNKAYQLTLTKYKFGAISYVDTIYSKLQLDDANAAYYQAKLAQIQSLVNLYKVLGGGYLVH